MRNEKYNVMDYHLINSKIHNLNFTYKVISIIFVLFGLVVADSIIDMFVINFYIVVMMLFSNVRIRDYVRGLNYIKFIVLIIIILFSILYLNIFIGILWGIKFLDFSLYLSIMMVTTSVRDVVVGCSRLLRPFKSFIDVRDVSIKMGVFSKFIPLMYSESLRINNSKKLRGVRFRDMNIIDKLEYVIVGSIPVYKACCDRAFKYIDVMKVRNYGIGGSISNYRLNKWEKTDTILLVINVLVIVITFIY